MSDYLDVEDRPRTLREWEGLIEELIEKHGRDAVLGMDAGCASVQLVILDDDEVMM